MQNCPELGSKLERYFFHFRLSLLEKADVLCDNKAKKPRCCFRCSALFREEFKEFVRYFCGVPLPLICCFTRMNVKCGKLCLACAAFHQCWS